MASAITAKWSAPGLLTYGNRPANPSTDLNRESKPLLNDPRERSGLVCVGTLVFADLVAALPGRSAARTPAGLVLRAAWFDVPSPGCKHNATPNVAPIWHGSYS